jgi:hypothetical protein
MSAAEKKLEKSMVGKGKFEFAEYTGYLGTLIFFNRLQLDFPLASIIL